MLNIHSLKAEERTALGTGPTRELRNKNMVPAIIYGAGKEQALFSISKKELTIEYKKQGFMSHMFDIEIGKKKHRALPKSIQLHPVTDEITHIDFIHVNENEKMKINITLHFINEDACHGIKQGGVLNVVRHDLEVYCLPKNIPGNIEVDIANLILGQSLHVSDITLPKGVETKADLGTTIATLIAGRTASADEDGDATDATDATDEAAK